MKKFGTQAVALLLLACAAGLPAWAVLGQPVQSVEADRVHLKGQIRLIQRQGYSVQRIAAADGGIVREFVSPDGIVFGVAWSGPAAPDLHQLLGAYFTAFQKAARQTQTPRRRRGPLAVQVDGLVVEVGGHMRAYRGRAYVESLIPTSVNQAVVQ